MENNECILAKKHFQYTCCCYLYSHLAEKKYNFSLAKNTDISKTSANLEKSMSFLDPATSKYPKTVKIFSALEKNYFC